MHIVFPVLCWGLVALRWSGIWFTKPCVTALIVLYYTIAAAYLISTFIVRMRIIAIVGLFLLLAASLFMWIPYHWVLSMFLVPALFVAFYKRKNKVTATVLTLITGIIFLSIFRLLMLFGCLAPEKYTFYISPDGKYVALEYAFRQIPSGTDVLLCRVTGPLLVQERVLYLANYSDYGSKIKWLDQSTIIIYGEKMDVFKDPTIHNYTPF